MFEMKTEKGHKPIVFCREMNKQFALSTFSNYSQIPPLALNKFTLLFAPAVL